MRIILARRERLDVPDGIAIFIYSMAEELLRLGHEVTVACGPSLDVTKVHKYFRLSRYPDFLSLGARRGATFPELLATWMIKGRTALNNLKPDFIVLNGALPFTFQAPTCTVSHDLERKLPHFGLARVAYKRFAYRRSPFIVVTCSELKTALSWELGIDPSRLHVIPTCVSPGSYAPRPLKDRENAILHMGTKDFKNPLGTIRAFALLKLPNAALFLTGAPNETVANYLQSLDPSVRTRIKLLGHVSSEEFRELLGRVKVVSVPSDYLVPVASPTVIESFASGTPVVGSPCITRDLLEDRYNGYVPHCNDFQKRAAAFQQLLENEQLWSTMAGNALATAQRFSAVMVAKSYLALFGQAPPLF
jgi:glycosyltransferase involved in cell wall biosynthesis